MTIEQRIQLQIGALVLKLIAREHAEEELRVRIAELEAQLAAITGGQQ